MNVSRILNPTAPARGPKNDWIPPSSTTTSGSNDLFRDAKSGNTPPLKKGNRPPASPGEERERAAGQPGEKAGQDEGEQRMAADVHADEASPPRVLADRAEGVAERR